MFIESGHQNYLQQRTGNALDRTVGTHVCARTFTNAGMSTRTTCVYNSDSLELNS